MSEIINRAIVTNTGAQDLGHTLALRNTDPANINHAIIGYSRIRSVDPTLKASRQVAECAERAIFLGIENTDKYLIDAARKAQEAGRKKVGFSGPAAIPLNKLHEEVTRRQVTQRNGDITLSRF